LKPFRRNQKWQASRKCSSYAGMETELGAATIPTNISEPKNNHLSSALAFNRKEVMLRIRTVGFSGSPYMMEQSAFKI